MIIDRSASQSCNSPGSTKAVWLSGTARRGVRRRARRTLLLDSSGVTAYFPFRNKCAALRAEVPQRLGPSAGRRQQAGSLPAQRRHGFCLVGRAALAVAESWPLGGTLLRLRRHPPRAIGCRGTTAYDYPAAALWWRILDQLPQTPNTRRFVTREGVAANGGSLCGVR